MSFKPRIKRDVILRTAIAALCAVTAVHAPRTLADTAAGTAAEGSLDEVIVTGTRELGIKAVDSAAPIQIVSSAELRRAGTTDLMGALASLVPSLQMQAFGFDMAGQTLQARLRGVSPNDVLVLINGKRRHTTANLAVDTGSPFQGAAGVDLNFVPLDAIDHIEVLQDGAAAQYGSDAIAGVVNIILKSNDSGGVASATGGQYYQNGGKTGAWSINNGGKLTDQGFINFTLEERYHEHSFQGGPDRRLFDINGNILASDGPVNSG